MSNRSDSVIEQRLREAEPRVRTRARSFLRAHPQLESSLLADLLQEGRIAVLRAHRRFDPKQNVAFNTYAAKWIDGSFLNLTRKLQRPGCFCLPEQEPADDGGWPVIEQLVSLDWVTKGLTPEQKVILRGYYFEGKDRPALSRELGVAQTRVSHLHREAITHLREAMGASRAFLFSKAAGLAR